VSNCCFSGACERPVLLNHIKDMDAEIDRLKEENKTLGKQFKARGDLLTLEENENKQHRELIETLQQRNSELEGELQYISQAAEQQREGGGQISLPMLIKRCQRALQENNDG